MREKGINIVFHFGGRDDLVEMLLHALGYIILTLSHHFFFIVMVINAMFYNISVISLGSVFLVEETGVPGENNLTVTSH